jgi:hypothetical protein
MQVLPVTGRLIGDVCGDPHVLLPQGVWKCATREGSVQVPPCERVSSLDVGPRELHPGDTEFLVHRRLAEYLGMDSSRSNHSSRSRQ